MHASLQCSRPLSDWVLIIYESDSFQTSIASIRRTSQPFQYELVVNRSVEEGQEAFLDAEAEDCGSHNCTISSVGLLS